MAFLQGLFGPPNIEGMASKGDVDGLIKALGYKKDASVREAAAEALAKMGATAVEPLMSFLKSSVEEETTQVACKALAKIGTPAIKPLVTALADEGFRPKAVFALAEIGAPAVAPLIDAMASSGPPWQRRAGAAVALGMLGSKLEDAALRGLIVDELACSGVYFGTERGRPESWPKGRTGTYSDPKISENCFQSLLWIGDVRALRLMALVGFGREYTRQNSLAEQVFRGIAEKAGRRAIGPIIEILKGVEWDNPEQIIVFWSEPTQRVIFEVLRGITGENFGDEVAMWEQWWEKQQ